MDASCYQGSDSPGERQHRAVHTQTHLRCLRGRPSPAEAAALIRTCLILLPAFLLQTSQPREHTAGRRGDAQLPYKDVSGVLFAPGPMSGRHTLLVPAEHDPTRQSRMMCRWGSCFSGERGSLGPRR